MSSIGIIAEYNPITNGHLYHIKRIKEKNPDSTIIVVMNSHFTERGEPTIIDKWKRTEIILNLGVDLVVELPYPFATQSADFFAYGATTILEHLKVDKIVFGSENDNVNELELIAKTQLESSDFDKLVKVYSKLGNNYPTALSNALLDITGIKITTPNDLLGISYIKAIIKNHYHIKYETIKRENNYHEKEVLGSASSIREALKENKNIEKYIPEIEKEYLETLHFQEDYFSLLKYKIITEQDLSIYQTVEEGIEHLLKKEIGNVKSYQELLEKIKSKRYTYNKLNRMLNHILCGFTKEKASKMQDIRYIRILGLNKKGKTYLNKIKKEIKIPIISKITRNQDEMLSYDIETTKIYEIPHQENLSKREFQSIIYIGDEKDD